MKPPQIVAQLRAYSSAFPAEVEALSIILGCAHLGAALLDRGCLPGHFTGSSWIVTRDKQWTLLLFHRKLERWLQPGGHADGDPNLLAVAMREAREETGINSLEPAMLDVFDVDAHVIPESTSMPSHYHFDIRYLLVVEERAATQESSESNGIQWIRMNDLENLGCDAGMLRMRDKAINFALD